MGRRSSRWSLSAADLTAPAKSPALLGSYNGRVGLSQFQPMTLVRTKEAFDHADFVFELKYDGFRALAYVDAGSCRLVSRKNHVYKSYTPLCEWIGKHLRAGDAVLDGELVCLDEEGKPQFNRLLRRRGDPVFVAF